MNKYRVYSDEEEEALNAFCKENEITRIGDEFYFEIEGQKYRISRYSIKVSKNKRHTYQIEEKAKPTIYIKAKRSEVMDIYKRLKEPEVEEEIEEEIEDTSSKGKQQRLLNDILKGKR